MNPRIFHIRRDRRVSLEDEVREEVETHIAMWADHLVARGMSRDDAERHARARFGSFDAALGDLYLSARRREEQMLRHEWWNTLSHELVFAIRQARRQPVFMIVALLTFALGIGATTAIFSVVRGVLLRPLPFREPARLAAIWPSRAISNAELLYLQREAKSFESISALSLGWGIAMTGAGEPRQLHAARTSVNFFNTLGARTLLGRSFASNESERGAWSVVVLSHELWTTQFGSDTAVIGRIVDMDGQPTRIIGVMPPGFEALQAGVDAWLPLQIDPSSPFHTGALSVGLGRLARNASFASATAELAGVAPRMRVAFSYADDYARGATVTSLHESLVGDVRRSLLVLLGAVGLLVAIAVANVGNLMLVHASGRQRELAVRRALGASPQQIIRQLLVQSLLIAVSGGMLGILVGTLSLRLLKSILPSTLPMLAAVNIDWGVLGVCSAITIVAGLAFGIGPALLASRVDPEGALRAGTAESSGRGHSFMRDSLVVAEVALAVVLVVGASLMTKTLWRLNRVDVGFDPRNVLTFLIQPTSGQIKSPAQATAYFDEVTRRVAAVPGVKSVGAAQHLPLSGFNWQGSLEIESRPIPQSATHPSIVWRSVVANYFGAMRIPLVRGRLFTEADSRDAPRVILISAAMAKHYWPDRDPIGDRIRLGNATQRDWAAVVGIVGDVRSAAPNAPAVEEAYRPNAQQDLHFMHFVVRAGVDPLTLVSPVRAAVHSFDQTVPVAEVRLLGDVFAASTETSRVVALLLVAFASLGLILGAVGIYGVISFSVGQRTRELGIRTALGAIERRLALMILGEGLRTSGLGVLIGLVVAVIAVRPMESLLFEVKATDPVIYVAVACALLLVALAASYFPARRAARIDPLVALRSE
jgi:putative ABC transport system permease protein